MRFILFPFRLFKLVFLTALVLILLMPLFTGTLTTFHSMKAAHAAAQQRDSSR